MCYCGKLREKEILYFSEQCHLFENLVVLTPQKQNSVVKVKSSWVTFIYGKDYVHLPLMTPCHLLKTTNSYIIPWNFPDSKSTSRNSLRGQKVLSFTFNFVRIPE